MGESDSGFASYAVDDTGRDLVKVARHLCVEGKSVVLVGCSMCAASVVWAAAELGLASLRLVLLSPFVWDHDMPFGVASLLSCFLSNNCIAPSFWTNYYGSLYTNQRISPTADLAVYIKSLKRNLAEPGRSKALYAHVFASKAACAARISEIISKGIPTLAIYGEKDPDFAPRVEKEVQEMTHRFGPVLKAPPLCLPGVGHYPHVEEPKKVAEAILAFLLA